MKNIIEYFRPKRVQNILEKQKTTAFIIIGLFGIFISSIMATKGMITRGENFILNVVPTLALALFITATLFILKKTSIKLTGNIFAVGLILLIVGAINTINEDISIFYKFTGGFYTVLGLYSIGVLFASRKVILFNAVIILATTTRVYLYALEHTTPEQIGLVKNGYSNHTIALIISTLVFFFTNKFAQHAIDVANKDAKINQEQNDILLKLVHGIKISSGEISQASIQLSDISQQVSQSASEQAATTEELSSAMVEMLSIISLNTDRADNTEKITTDSAQEMKQSNDIFMKTLQSVSEISEKISIITEIAGKTDLLSINAAIEAARAGEVGKGFSVVAHEIRKLADKTKIASDQINELSENGKSISKLAGEKLIKTIPEITKSAELVNEIVLASKEQQNGAEMINDSIKQLTQITNSNSASSEEMSASAEELSAQAEHLNQMVSTFKLDRLQKD